MSGVKTVTLLSLTISMILLISPAYDNLSQIIIL